MNNFITTNNFFNRQMMVKNFILSILIYILFITIVKNWQFALIATVLSIITILIFIKLTRPTYSFNESTISLKDSHGFIIINYLDIISLELYQIPRNDKTIVYKGFVDKYQKMGEGSRGLFGVILVTDNQSKQILIDPMHMTKEELHEILDKILTGSKNLNTSTSDYIAIKKIFDENLFLDEIDAFATQIAEKRYPEEAKIIPLAGTKIPSSFIKGIFVILVCFFIFLIVVILRNN